MRMTLCRLRPTPGPRESFLEAVSLVRTEIRHRCPWVRSPRRVGPTDVRELGKLALYLRYKGCQLREELVAVTWGLRLFNKNIGGS